jgi:hypothetical protein
MNKNKNKEYIRWLGVASSIAILFLLVLIAKDASFDTGSALLVVSLGFLPAFVSVFTSIAKCFWPNLVIGLWFLFCTIKEIPYSKGTSLMLLTLAALALSSTPILNMIFGKKMSTPYQPSDPERQGAPEAFKYEMEIFCYAEGHLSNAQGNLRKAMIECALLHARNLLDFFTGNQPMTGRMDEKSIRAGHFIKENTWWKSDKLSYLQQRKKDINKSLSHLTYDRIGTEYEWNLAKIKDEIKASYTELLKLLPEVERSKWPPPENSGTD